MMNNMTTERKLIDIASGFMNDLGLHHWVYQWEDLGGTIYQEDFETGEIRCRGTSEGSFWTEWE